MTRPDPQPLPFAQLGHFAVLRRLGAGGMGEVFEARDGRLGRRVAIKLLRTDYAASEPLRQRFLNEARLASQLAHPNVATIFEVGEDHGRAFVAMELVEGETLSELVARGPLGVERALAVGAQVADGLAAAHALGIVHRDLKPDNVMIAADGLVKLLDFGLAKAVPESAQDLGLAQTQIGDDARSADLLLGTPLYMSPEQLSGGAVDSRSDVYAFGLVLFELLTGARARPSAPFAELAAAVLRDEAPHPSSQADIPASVDAFVVACLARAPGERPADGAALVQTLATVRAAFQSGGTAPTKLDSSLPRARTAALTARTRRSRAARWAAATLAATVAGLGAAALWAVGVASDGAATGAPPAPAESGSSTPSRWYEEAPEGISAEARAAHLRALAVYRRGGDYVRAFEEAAELAPELGGMRVRLAFWLPVDDARRHAEAAQLPSEVLTPFERGALPCVALRVGRQPADQCWRELAMRFPTNAEAVFIAGLAESDASALQSFEAAVALDPGFAHAMAHAAHRQAYRGRRADALALLDRALAVAPDSARALRESLWVHTGSCDGAVETARRLVAALPDGTEGNTALAVALAGAGRPAEAVTQGIGRVAAKERGSPLPSLMVPTARDLTLRHAVLRGRFREAIAEAEALATAVAASPIREHHAQVARWLVELLLETSQTDRAADQAQAYLGARDAWEPDPRWDDDYAIAKSATPDMLRALAAAGRLDATSRTRRLEQWLAERRVSELRPHRGTLSSPHQAGYVWLRGFSDQVQSPADAKEALAALARLGPIPPYRPYTLSAAGIGRTYLLAGELAEAERWLGEAVGDCHALLFPFESTRAHYDLGRLREAQGSRENACAAYRVVAERWGAELDELPSVTATAAADRMRATCATP